ncbi:MAG: HAD family hydrolase [Planctomycetota bacterium]|jgi:beta-phosphoglucomutase
MINGNRSKGVIFDLDGVLVNTGEFHRQSWYDLAEREGFEMSDELFYSTFGMQNYQIIPMLVGRAVTGEELGSLSQWKEGRYRELIKGKLELLDGVRELIDDLKRAGFLLAIGTSTPLVNLEFMLENVPVDGCFDAYVTGEDVKRGKPEPDTFIMAAEKLSLPRENCVVVEDAVQGVAAGKAAGMAVVAVTTTREREELGEADLIVDSLAEAKAEDFEKLLGS